jgi:PAS domain S-box-containing protein
MLLLTFAAYRGLAGRERTQMVRTTALAAESVERGLTAEIDLRVRPIERQARRWAFDPEGERSGWTERSAPFATLYSSFQSIAFVDAALRVRWFAPEFGNSSLAGRDYSTAPHIAPVFAAARVLRATRTTPIHDLPQGGQGFLVAVPVFRGTLLEGFLVASFRCTELLFTILDRAVPDGYSAEVVEGGRIIYRHPHDASPGDRRLVAERTFDAYGVPWRVRVWPNAQSLIEFGSSMPRIVLAAGILISLLVALIVRLAETARARSQELERANRQLAAEMSDRQRAADALLEAHGTLAAIIDTSPVAIVRASTSGIVTGWNRAAENLLGWSEDQALGITLARAGGEDLDRLRQHALSTPSATGAECILRRKDGLTVSADLWIARQPAPGGGSDGFICILADTGSRKELEQRLRDSTKLEAVSLLAAGIAHNFNNLLAIITGYSHLALETVPPGDPLRGEIEEVLRAADRAARLTVQLLAFGRGQPVHPEMLELNRVIEDLREVLENIAGEGYQVLTTFGPLAGRVRIDPQQVEQMLVTLVVNAREAMPGGGRIVVETVQAEVADATRSERLDVAPGHYAVVSVTDNGPGMDAPTIEHLFEPFFTTKGVGALGLGLSSLHGIAKQNGGGVVALSQPGQGTRIEVYLPLV